MHNNLFFNPISNPKVHMPATRGTNNQHKTICSKKLRLPKLWKTFKVGLVLHNFQMKVPVSAVLKDLSIAWKILHSIFVPNSHLLLRWLSFGEEEWQLGTTIDFYLKMHWNISKESRFRVVSYVLPIKAMYLPMLGCLAFLKEPPVHVLIL